jgi:cell division protein FtsQ
VANRRKVDRAQQARTALTRARDIALAVLRTAALLALAGTVIGLGYAGYVYATTSPRFAIRRIEVRGNERVPEAELLRLSGLAEGQNFFLADRAGAEAAIAEHPWVRAVHVARDFPQGITLAVLERSPVALVHVENLYLVDREGEVFKRWAPGDPVDLPVVTGVPREVWAERPDEARAELLEALSALAAWKASPVSQRASAAEVHVDVADGLTLYAGANDLVVKLGHDGIAEKLERLERVLAEAQARGMSLSLVRLDNRARPGWIAVRPKRAFE